MLTTGRSLAPVPVAGPARSSGSPVPPTTHPVRKPRIDAAGTRPSIVLTPRGARRIVDRDADHVLAISRGRPVPATWREAGFGARVERARLDLLPLSSPATLAESLAREAFHVRPWTDRPCAIRIAYAIRWIELASGVSLPAWRLWVARGVATHPAA
jgi:hypothetical protein